MKSTVIKAPSNQLTLELEPGLAERYSCLRECVATGVYQRGLKRVAGDLNEAPGNLSVQLSENPARHFSVDSLEDYIRTSGDKTPIDYLIAKYYTTDSRNAAKSRARRLLAEALQAMEEAGEA